MYYFEQKSLVAAVVFSACDFLKYWRDNGLKDNLVFKTKHNNKNKNHDDGDDDNEQIICISSILFNEVIKPVEIAFDVDCFNNVKLIFFIFFPFCHLVWGFDSHLMWMCVLICTHKFLSGSPFSFSASSFDWNTMNYDFFLNCKEIAMRFNLEKFCLPNQILATEKRNRHENDEKNPQ